jgi:hypothetical protein
MALALFVATAVLLLVELLLGWPDSAQRWRRPSRRMLQPTTEPPPTVSPPTVSPATDANDSGAYVEAMLVTRLMANELGRADYQQAMAALAREDESVHPLTLPPG